VETPLKSSQLAHFMENTHNPGGAIRAGNQPQHPARDMNPDRSFQDPDRAHRKAQRAVLKRLPRLTEQMCRADWSITDL
jgi:hypothetical protein